VDVVRDDAAEAHLAGERGKGVAERGGVGIEVVGELDEEAVAEDGAEPRERLTRRVEVARPDRPRDRAVRAAGEREEAGGVLGEERKRRLGLRFLPG
jgi:hypothetical protein